MTDPRSELENPGTSAQRLFEIAQSNPELGAFISAHPNAYPELKQWVAQYAAPVASEDTDPTAQPQTQPEASQPAQQEPAVQQPQTQQAAPQQYGQPQAAPQQFGAPTPQSPQPYAAQQPTAPQQFTAEQPTAPQPYTAPQAGIPQYAQPAGPLTHGGAPGGPIPPAGMPMAAGQQPPRKSRKKVWIISIAAALVVALLATGGIIWMNIANKISGSATPEAAAAKVLDGIASFDPLTLYGSFAPSEIAAFKAPLEEWLDVKPSEDDKSVQEMIDRLKGAIDIKVEGLEFTTEQIVEGVERVTYTAGTITVDGDTDEIIDAFMDLYRASDDVNMGALDLEDIEDELRRELVLPQTLDFADFNNDSPMYSGFVPSVVTVEEGGSWYISPLLTGADLAYQTASAFGARVGELGTSIIEGKPSDTPGDAAAALADAIVNGSSMEEIIERLPLAERRLLSIYGPAIELPRGWNDDISLEAAEFSSENGDANARVNIEDLSIGSFYYSSGAGRDLETSVKFYDHCVEVTSESYSYSSRQVREETNGGCLGDLLPRVAYEDLGIEHFQLIAVPEDGGWYLSPIGTIADMAAIFISHIAELSEEGRLEDVLNELSSY